MGLLGEKQECCYCAMQPPRKSILKRQTLSLMSFLIKSPKLKKVEKFQPPEEDEVLESVRKPVVVEGLGGEAEVPVDDR